MWEVKVMKKSIAIIFALSLLLLAFTACGRSPERQLAGRWEADGTAQFQVMEFIPHNDNPQRGRVNLRMLGNQVEGEYEVTPGEDGEQHQLTITYTLAMFPTTQEFTFTVEGNTLTLQGERDDDVMAFQRARG